MGGHDTPEGVLTENVTLTRPAVTVAVSASGPPTISVGGGIASITIKRDGIGGASGGAGPPGPAGGVTTVIAGEVLGGHRAVYIGADGQAYYADTGDTNGVVGITEGAAALGGEVTVRFSGEIIEPSWSWAPGVVYLGTSGLLTQIPTAAGALIIVGNSSGPTKLIVAPQIVALL